MAFFGKKPHVNLTHDWKNALSADIDFCENLWISDKRDENDGRDRVCGIILPKRRWMSDRRR